jgi:putative ABC transport system permease protein
MVADVRFALRQFRRRPFVTATMMTVLAIGLGIATTPFVLISSFTATPLAAVDPDAHTVRIRGIDLGQGPGRAIGREFSYAEVLEYAARTTVFADVGAWTSTDVTLDLGSGDSPNLQSGAATFVTASYFHSLGVRPVRGAGLPESFANDAPPQLQAVISDTIWERFHERADDVIGRTLKVNNSVVTIVGVAPRAFNGARAGGSSMRVWLPVNARPVVQPSAPALRSEAATFGVIGRLQPGVSFGHASTVAATVADRFGSRVSTDVVTALASNYFPPSGEPPTVTGPLLSLTMPLLVLLITCTSVSALLAGQALSRRQEIAIRLAMGAHRRRIVRQLLTETVLLGLGAGGLALLVVWWLLSGAEAVWVGPGAWLVVDWRAGVFIAALALVASLAFGLSPARHATRTAVAAVMKEGDSIPGRTRLQSTLVIAQIALTQPALLIMGTLLLDLRTELREVAPMTVAADRLVEVGFNTNPRYGALDDRREAAIARVRAQVAALPGVVGAVPAFLGGGGHERLVSPPDDRAEGAAGVPEAEAAVHPAPDGYFDVMGLTLAAGRLFSSAEATTATDLAIVNRALARRLWGDAPPLGRRVHIAHNHPPLARTVTIIGMVDGEHDGRDGGDSEPQLFVAARGETTSHLVVRTLGPADDTVPAIRAAALSAAPDVPITTARTRESREAEARRPIVWGVIAAGISGAVALLLAAIGLYAVISVSVGQRRREIAVRSALGADRRAITTVFVKRGLLICLVGAGVGLGLSTVVYRLMAQAQMFGQNASSSVGGGVIVLVTVFVFAVGLIASWIPARRAAAIDPWSVLRAE